MNKIDIKIAINEFTNYNYYDIVIDEVSLEKIILKNSNKKLKKGLVSTFLNWLENNSDRNVVWSRALPKENETTYLPILMCSEDIDLYCDVVIAETKSDNKYVYWKRFGLDIGNGENMPESIGEKVEWFESSLELIFEKAQYIEVLTKFKKYLNEQDPSICYK